MTANEILQIYQGMLEIEEKICAAVKNEDWNIFVKLTEQLEEKKAALQELDIGIQMSGQEISKKKELIEKFLTIDEQVKFLIKLKMTFLEATINNTAMQDKISQRYGNLRTQ